MPAMSPRIRWRSAKRPASSPFFEPKSHLTNGSLLREFSAIFTDEIEETMAVVLAAPRAGALARDRRPRAAEDRCRGL